MKIDKILGRPVKVLTWHVHGSYLHYLTQTPVEFILPVKPGKEEGYAGKSGAIPWGLNITEIPAEDVKNHEFDCVLFQSAKNYMQDQFEILSEEQRKLPFIFLEHDLPETNLAETPHIINDPETMLVHVAHFNKLMWDNNRSMVKVIEHGVPLPEDVKYNGILNKGVVVLNAAKKEIRKSGYDLFQQIKEHIPLDLIGKGTEEWGGLGEIKHTEFASFISQYRFMFNPVRYSSLKLSVCEAMMLGMPVVSLATSEMPVLIQNDISGYVHTDLDYLVLKMEQLLKYPDKAIELGEVARKTAIKKFQLQRFTSDWLKTFETAVHHRLHHLKPEVMESI